MKDVRVCGLQLTREVAGTRLTVAAATGAADRAIETSILLWAGDGELTPEADAADQVVPRALMDQAEEGYVPPPAGQQLASRAYEGLALAAAWAAKPMLGRSLITASLDMASAGVVLSFVADGDRRYEQRVLIDHPPGTRPPVSYHEFVLSWLADP